jgi:hypothetical protein
LKRPAVLAMLVVVLLTFTLLPAHRANASQAYGERITAYVAGANALWYMSFDGVNATAPGIAAVEGEAGVNWYNVTLLKTSSWSSDSQVFGPNGFNLLRVPFVPPQGAFLTVGAGSYSTALSAAETFDSYLLTSFFSYSNSTGVYTFYTPLSFSEIAPSTLLRFIPTGAGGFASAVSASAFAATQSPMISLQGIREGTAFAHNLTLGSIAGGALSTLSQPNILSYFGATVSSLQASNTSSSSVIYLRFLDGQVNSRDKAAVVTSSPGSGSYELSLAPKQEVHTLNVTVDQTPELLLARRVIDRGVLMHGQNVSVTTSLSNPSGLSAIKTSAFSDGWWKSYGFFKLVKGNSTVPVETVMPGVSVSPTYVLEYTGSGTGQVTVPPASINYTYDVGTKAFGGTASSNPVSLSLGEDNPVIYAYLVPAKNSEGPVGSTQSFNITVKNVGTLTASSEVVAGQQEGGLLAGSSITVSVPVTAQSLDAGISSMSYPVSYSTPSGQNFTVATNSVPVLFTHTSMTVGMPSLTLSASVAHLVSGKTNLTLAFTAANRGSANLTGFTATGALPPGLACGTSKGAWVSCFGGHIMLSPLALSASENAQASVEFDLASGVNYFFAPFVFQATTAGLVLAGESNAVAAPAGVILEKQFTPASVFAGMSSSVQLMAVNRGPFTAYNATVQSRADSFDALTAFSPLPLKYSPSIGAGDGVNVTYVVVAQSSYGNLTSSPTTASLYFGGVQYNFSQPGPYVSVYRPVAVSITASPSSPTEGRPFSLGIAIHNPSSAPVSDVKFSLPIPSAMTVSNLQNAVSQGGNLTVSVGQLGPEQSFVANATAQASSGVSLQFSTGTLAFSYSGATVRSPVPNKEVIVGEDVFTRYTLPSVVVLVGVLATAFYVRMRLAPISPATER